MTDNELDQQAKLWHVTPVLRLEKTETLHALLSTAAPKARLRQRWRLFGLGALTLASFPLGGFAVLLLSVNPLAKESTLERLEPYTTDSVVNPFALAPDGTVGGYSDQSKESGDKVTSHPLLWRPGCSKPELLSGLGWVSGFCDDGTPIGTMVNPKGQEVGALWHTDRVTELPPLPGYSGAQAQAETAQGIIGESIQGEKHRVTLWRGGKPEAIRVGDASDSRVDAVNAHGALLVRMYRGEALSYGVLQGTKLTLLKPLTPGQMFHAFGLGGEGTVVGMATDHGLPVATRWSPPRYQPERLLPAHAVFDMESSACNGIDTRGRMVGMMTPSLPSALTGAAAFLWEKGKVTDLNTFLPPFSGHRLFSANQLQGRYVLGQETFKGNYYFYRLTLPRQYK